VKILDLEVIHNMSEQESKSGKEATKADMLKLKEKIKKKDSKDQVEFAKQLATRDKLERDYKEDHIYVTFNSSPETRRTILARRPTKKEFLEVLRIGLEAAKFDNLGDAKSLEKLNQIYSGFNKIAAKLSIDKKLDEQFWDECISFSTLQNFINELLAESQKSIGGVTEGELQSFRGK
jgi:preprotein translocase subunit Sss1